MDRKEELAHSQDSTQIELSQQFPAIMHLLPFVFTETDAVHWPPPHIGT